MKHYTSNFQGFLLDLGVKRSATTLCGLVLDEAEDYGDCGAECPECRRLNGDKR